MKCSLACCMRQMAYAVIIAAMASPLAAQEGQLARTPPMGWNDWYQYECKVSDTIMRANADALASNGPLHPALLAGLREKP